MVKYKQYKWDTVGKVLAYTKMYCPICDESFHVKATIRTHLNKEHSKYELEKFLFHDKNKRIKKK